MGAQEIRANEFHSDQPYSTYALYLSSFNPPAALMDFLLSWLLYRAVETAGPESGFPTMQTAFVVFLSWLLFSKVVKFIPYFRQYPSDLKFVPVLVGFGYFHGLIYLYTLLTLHKVSSRLSIYALSGSLIS